MKKLNLTRREDCSSKNLSTIERGKRISTKEDLKLWLELDRRALKRPKMTLKMKFVQFIWPNEIWRFERLLRYSEYYANCQPVSLTSRPLWLVKMLYYKYQFKRLSLKLGFSIPLNVFGPGLSIAHYGTIVVNQGTKVGKNCRIHASVNIGASAGRKEAPVIGDNCYIGPGAILFGNIQIANNTTIAANATVNRSCIQERVVLAGTPAKIVKEDAPTWIEFNNVSI